MLSKLITRPRNIFRRRKAKPLSGKGSVSGQTPPPWKRWKYYAPKDLKKFKNLLFAARNVVEGHYAGKHKSCFKGSAPEFVDYRQYYPGDDLRTIDWKTYARTDKFFVKLFEKETDMDCYILLDSSASMAYDGSTSRSFSRRVEGQSKLDYACYLTAALAYLMIKQGDKVGLTLFDQDIRSHVPPAGTFGHLYKVLNALEQSKPGNPTSISTTLRKTFGLYKRRGLLIIISDMLDDPEEIFKALSLYTHRHFEILIFHVFHKSEYQLPLVANANFVDLETGERMTCNPADLAEAYNAEIKGYIQTLSSMSRARGIDYNFINTDTPYSAVLEKYLLRRQSLVR